VERSGHGLISGVMYAIWTEKKSRMPSVRVAGLKAEI
jgi:hypothetical protein